MADTALSDWVTEALGHAPRDPALFARALTHGSQGGPSYERLEFLGDRVLGLSVAAWLYGRFTDEPEGKLSARLNSLVSRETCAAVGREIGVPEHLILGKQVHGNLHELGGGPAMQEEDIVIRVQVHQFPHQAARLIHHVLKQRGPMPDLQDG